MRIGVGKGFQPHQFQDFVDPVPLFLEHAPGIQPRRDILADGEPWEQRGLLEHQDTIRIRPVDRFAVFAQLSFKRRLQSRRKPQEGRLAATGRAEKRDELAGFTVIETLSRTGSSRSPRS